MINIDNIFRFLQSQANKNFGGGFTIDRFNLNFNEVQKSFFWELIGLNTKANGNQETNNRFAMGSESNNESLRPFYVNNTLINFSNGIGQLPINYAYIDNLLVEYNDGVNYRKREVQQIDAGTQGWIFESSLLQPTTEYPKFEFVGNTIKIYPSTNAAYLSYWKKPTDALWDYTTVNGRPVYNPVTSINSEFNEKDTSEITARLAKLLGINIKDGELIQFAQNNIIQGT